MFLEFVKIQKSQKKMRRFRTPEFGASFALTTSEICQKDAPFSQGEFCASFNGKKI
jgi:hypothetical protein